MEIKMEPTSELVPIPDFVSRMRRWTGTTGSGIPVDVWVLTVVPANGEQDCAALGRELPAYCVRTKELPPREQPRVIVPEMCERHMQLLVQQLGYSSEDPWRALVIIAQIALFQAATADPRTHARIASIEDISSLGCLACYKPDAFGLIVDAAQRAGREGDMAAIKALGDGWATPRVQL